MNKIEADNVLGLILTATMSDYHEEALVSKDVRRTAIKDYEERHGIDFSEATKAALLDIKAENLEEFYNKVMELIN